MRPQPSRARIIGTIVAKDLRAFTRDRFWLFMTFLGLFWLSAIYYLLPRTVDETLTVGVHWTDTDAAYAAAFPSGSGFEFRRFASTEELEAALGIGEEVPDEPLDVGLDYPADFLIRVTLGQATTVRLLVDPVIPEEVRTALAALVRETAYALTGHALPIGAPTEEVILGEDRFGRQVPLRDKMRPLYAFMMLVVETYALGALIAEEISARTVTAVLITPARVSDFLLAKGLLGTLVAFGEAMVLMAVVRGLGRETLLMTVALLFGAVLVTGVALIAGASGRDFVGLVFYSLMFLIPLMIPAFAALFPGTASPWVKILPTYGLAQTIVGVTAYDQGWSDSLGYLAALGLWCVVLFGVGLVVLRRKVESL